MLGLSACGSSGKNSTDTPTNNSSTTSDKNNKVDSELKAFLDLYEDFVDEYCAFMKKYAEADTMNMLSMIQEYTTYMTRLADMQGKANALDSGTMTAADYAYYSEVLLRCSQKMLEAAQ